MVSYPEVTNIVPEDVRAKLLAAATESIARSSGRGSHQFVNETILSKHDRFGSAPVQINSELVGLTFITRPQLNLTSSSLRQDSSLVMLDTLDPRSFQFAIRCNLDSIFSRSAVARDAADACPWFNDESPFNIPLSNLILGISGYPDLNLEYKTTESGYHGEDMTMARGSDRGRRTYNLTCTFRDIQGGFLMAMFLYWIHAMALQMEGIIVPYPDDRDANRLNYTVSIYRFVLDSEMRTIQSWNKATGCYPVSVPIGEKFNFGPGDSQIHTSQQFTVPFIANHISYMDPRQLSEFNTLVRRYAGKDIMTTRVKTPVGAGYNFAGTPYIDQWSGTNELMFLAKKEELIDTSAATFESIMKSVRSSLQS